MLPGREPAPLEPPRQPLSGDSHAHLAGPLERLASQLGYSVQYRLLAGADGVCDPGRRRISIDAGLEVNAQMATLVHELCHALIHQEPASDQRMERQVEELVVEAVTYVVLAAVGLDTGRDSVPYIAGWQGDDAPEQLTKAAQLIDALARRIEQTIEAQQECPAA